MNAYLLKARSSIGFLAALFFFEPGAPVYSASVPSSGETGVAISEHAVTACGQTFTQHEVQQGSYRIHVREYAGAEPAFVLMHGFPDNLHLYDRLVPQLCGRHLVLFDFLGWGKSDKPSPKDYAYTFDHQKDELDAVITQRGLTRPVLVAHDASGPAAINWALDHRQDVGGLVLLNTFYHLTPNLSAPEAIAIFADLLELRTAPLVSPTVPWSFQRLSKAIASDPEIFRRLYYWQVGSFFRDDEVRREFLPKLFAQFAHQPSTRHPFLTLNRDLGAAIVANSQRAPELAGFERPVRIIFGDSDPYLNAALAHDFQTLIPGSELFLIPNARHFVQMDEPEAVARLMLAMQIL